MNAENQINYIEIIQPHVTVQGTDQAELIRKEALKAWDYMVANRSSFAPQLKADGTIYVPSSGVELGLVHMSSVLYDLISATDRKSLLDISERIRINIASKTKGVPASKTTGTIYNALIRAPRI